MLPRAGRKKAGLCPAFFLGRMMASTRKIALIMPAAGAGSRLGLGRPKALVEIAGRPLVRVTLEAFQAVEGMVETVLAVPAGAIEEVAAALKGLQWPGCALRVVAGGETRQASVRIALEALAQEPEWVCVHDAARPLVTPRTIAATIEAAGEYGAATAACRVPDSLREEDEEGHSRPLDRTKIWAVQTPQVFAFELLARAHRSARATKMVFSDDASLVQRCCRHEVALVPTDRTNLKITDPADLALVRSVLERRRAGNR